MENKNLQKKIMTYVCLGCLFLILIVYFLVYKKNIDEADSIKSSNASLRERVTVLQEYFENESFYLDEISKMEEEIKEKADEFPVDVKEENILVTALNTLNEASVEYTNINLTDREAMSSVDEEVVRQAQIEGFDEMLIFAKRNASYVNNCDYYNLKSVIESINSEPDRSSISKITYSKDEENNCLEGTIEVDFYYLLGTDKVYEEVDLAQYEEGLDDLFNLKTLEELQAEAELEALKLEESKKSE